MLKAFKEFIMKGNVVDMSVGIIVGAAFSSIVKSLVDDIIMPPIGLILGGVDFSNLFFVLKEGNPSAPYTTLELAKKAGAVTLNYGVLINNTVSFLIISFAVFLLINSVNKLKRTEVTAEPTTKECPHCYLNIPIKAKRCPHCTSTI